MGIKLVSKQNKFILFWIFICCSLDESKKILLISAWMNPVAD